MPLRVVSLPTQESNPHVVLHFPLILLTLEVKDAVAKRFALAVEGVGIDACC